MSARVSRLLRRLDGMTMPLTLYSLNRAGVDWNRRELVYQLELQDRIRLEYANGETTLHVNDKFVVSRAGHYNAEAGDDGKLWLVPIA